jgi:hypothetical protein
VALLGGMSWELWFIGSAIICGFLYIGSKLKNNKPEEISSNVKQLLNEGGSTIGLTPDIDNLTTLLDNLNKITKKKQI